MTVRDACPTAWAPMPSGDGLLARLHLRAATLGAADARALARLARRHGNGLIEITRRGNLQVRGLGANDVVPFARALARRGLAGADAAADGRRRLEASPLAALAPGFAATWAAIEAALDRALRQARGLGPKFAVRIEAGAAIGAAVAADLVVRPRPDGVAALIVNGRSVTVANDALPDAVAAVVAAIDATAERRAAALAPERVDRTLAAATGRTAVPAGPGAVGPGAAGPGAAGPVPVGALCGAARAVGIAPPFGALDAEGLGVLAALARRHGDGALRLAPGAVLVAGVAGPDALLAAAAARGFVVEPDDQRLRVRACAGAPRCGAGRQPARASAPALLGLVPPQGVLHVSGCAKGCAHPQPAALVLVGQSGGGYATLRDARADAVA